MADREVSARHAKSQQQAPSIIEYSIDAIRRRYIELSREPEARSGRGYDELEKMRSSIAIIETDPSVDPEIEFRDMPLMKYPSLNAFLEGAPVKKASRPRRAQAERCPDRKCQGIMDGGTCTECGMQIQEVVEQTSSRKARNASTAAIREFSEELEILLAEKPLPRIFAEKCKRSGNITKLEKLRAKMIEKGINLEAGHLITEAIMRSCMKEIDEDLQKYYIWANAVIFVLTRYRAAPAMTQRDKKILCGYYNMIIDTFDKNAPKLAAHGKKPQTRKNHWNVQAYIKLIMMSCPALRQKYIDFYGTLHTQDTKTEGEHCAIWEEMRRLGKWSFDEPLDE